MPTYDERTYGAYCQKLAELDAAASQARAVLEGGIESGQVVPWMALSALRRERITSAARHLASQLFELQAGVRPRIHRRAGASAVARQEAVALGRVRDDALRALSLAERVHRAGRGDGDAPNLHDIVILFGLVARSAGRLRQLVLKTEHRRAS